jgi:hypothetical protein
VWVPFLPLPFAWLWPRPPCEAKDLAGTSVPTSCTRVALGRRTKHLIGMGELKSIVAGAASPAAETPGRESIVFTIRKV